MKDFSSDRQSSKCLHPALGHGGARHTGQGLGLRSERTAAVLLFLLLSVRFEVWALALWQNRGDINDFQVGSPHQGAMIWITDLEALCY